MRFTLIALTVILAISASIVTTTIAQQSSRQWSSRVSNETIEATFQGYDPKTKLVTLQISGGDKIYFELKKLSNSDQRYVTQVGKNKKGQVVAAEESIFGPAAKKRIRSKRKPQSNTVVAYGIHWTPGMEAALISASGKESVDDDRPVMWMRVLGDLGGLM